MQVNAALQELVRFFLLSLNTFVYSACCLSDMYVFCLFSTYFVLHTEFLNDSFVYVVVERTLSFFLKRGKEYG